jgi:hypothetical protein
MLCALLKAFKVYFISTAIFTSSGTVFKDDKQKTVAVSYSLASDIHAVNSSITAIYDLRYKSCFTKSIKEASYILNTPDVSFRVKSWRKNRPTVPPVKPFFFPRSITAFRKKPTVRPYHLKQKRLPISKQLVVRVDVKQRNATHTISNHSSSTNSTHSSPHSSPRASPRLPPPAPPSGTAPPPLKL